MADASRMPRHTDSAYEHELRTLRKSLTLMAGRVEQMVAHAMVALAERSGDRGRATIEEDHKVNQAEIDIDELCLLILAKRQPMASDLRFITFALKMVTDLERIGDLAVNIAERAIDLSKTPVNIRIHQHIPRMAELVQVMINDAIDAFINKDAAKAREVIARDDEIDELYHQVFRELLSDMPTVGEAELHALIHIQSVAKWLERMGDHTTNLAELVVFMIRGTDIRHYGKLDEPAS